MRTSRDGRSHALEDQSRKHEEKADALLSEASRRDSSVLLTEAGGGFLYPRRQTRHVVPHLIKFILEPIAKISDLVRLRPASSAAWLGLFGWINQDR